MADYVQGRYRQSSSRNSSAIKASTGVSIPFASTMCSSMNSSGLPTHREVELRRESRWHGLDGGRRSAGQARCNDVNYRVGMFLRVPEHGSIFPETRE